MMKVFICPKCGWMRTVSRRKEVECFKCGCRDMKLSRLSFLEYSDMSDEQREDYAASWRFLHARG
jgi:predicted nucleic-acid-binding Zn-ribbon protein